MKIILSRKGFDSSAGGMPSPILADGTMLSLPIPESPVHHPDAPFLSELPFPGLSGSSIPSLHHAAQKSGASWKKLADMPVHHDPVLHGNLGALGQANQAQSHLAKQGVGEGDLFLFFGWFAHQNHPRDSFLALHGHLQVEQVLRVEANKRHPLVQKLKRRNFPHVLAPQGRGRPPNDTVYISQSPGTGFLNWKWRSENRLSIPGRNRSEVRLPRCFHPKIAGSFLSWHGDTLNRWTLEKNSAVLQMVYRGQEFVIEANKEMECWVRELIDAQLKLKVILDTR